MSLSVKEAQDKGKMWLRKAKRKESLDEILEDDYFKPVMRQAIVEMEEKESKKYWEKYRANKNRKITS